MIKLYAGIAISAAVALLAWRYSYISGELEKSQERANRAESVAAQMQRNRELENWSRGEYIKQIEAANREKERVENCITNRTCVATVRVRVPTVCPGGSKGDTPGAEEFAAQLSPAAARTRAALEHRIVENEAALAMCVRTLEQWATK
jgi:hypothetical protein